MTAASLPRLTHNRRVINDRFRLVRSLGVGGMGEVWECVEERTWMRRALKFIKDDEKSPVNVQRFLREAAVTSAIKHPNIVSIEEVATDDDGTPVIVMEYLEGESLATRLVREDVLTLGQSAAIVQRIAAALRAAHAAGVVHRDLKPENVFLVLEPTGMVDVRVLDFGIAKHFSLASDKLTVTGQLVGTPLYMSPEQAGGEGDLDARSDVWSIAVILFECISGTTPVTGDNFGQLLTRLIRQDLTRITALCPDVPPDVIALLDAAFVRRSERTLDLATIERTLSPYADPTLAPIPAPVPSAGARPGAAPAEALGDTVSVTWRNTATAQAAPRRSGRAVLIAAAVVAMLVVVGGVGSYAMRVRARRAAAEAPPVKVAAQPGEGPREPAPDLPPATPTLAPTTEPTTVAPVAPVAPASAASTKHSASVLSRAHAGAAPSASASATHGAPPPRLQGGVSGEVPF